MRFRQSLLAAVFVCASNLAQAHPGMASQGDVPRPSAVLESTAQKIEARYFDAEKGKAIAAALRAFASSPEVRTASDPRVFAARTTDFLQKYDGHFALLWAPAAGAAGGLPQIGPARWEALQNYGFHEVRRLPGNIGYVDLRSFATLDSAFSENPARRAADAAMQLLDPVSAVVLDLRNNGGGSSEMLAYLMAYFLPDKPFLIARFRMRSGPMEESWTPKVTGRRRPDIPLVVLTSGRTPSAAESFIYGLQQAGRKPILVGERTAGEANPVAYIAVGGGFTAHVPFGTPVDPRTGGNWEGTGIAPDVPVEASAALSEGHFVALKAVLARRGDESEALEAKWAMQALGAERRERDYDASIVAGSYGSRQISVKGSHLFYARKRWPPMRLLHVGAYQFAVETRPDLQIRFRIQDGKVHEMHEASARGGVLVFPRD